MKFILVRVFTPGQIYKRSEIHDKYGGNRQNGISVSAKTPNIFIFTGGGGKQHGYRDRWENPNIFSYTGEGQEGDMEFTRGNLKLRDHQEKGMRVFLFEAVRKGHVRFVSEVEVFDWDLFETHDRNGKMRMGIKFFFKRAEASLPVSRDDLQLQLPLAAEPGNQAGYVQPNTTERTGLVTSRVGQGAYRKSILHRWEYSCAVTKFSNPKVLIASHILPWRDANDDQRLDVDNGILLSPDFDALFDRHMISFDEKGHILVGSELQHFNAAKLGIRGDERILNFSDRNQHYLEFHRSRLK